MIQLPLGEPCPVSLFPTKKNAFTGRELNLGLRGKDGD